MKSVVRKRMVGTIPLLEVVTETAVHDPLPLIVYYHGWQTSKELVLTQGRKLAMAGFRVLLPDAANHGERKQTVSPIPSLTFWQSIQTNLFEFSYLIEYFDKLALLDGRLGVGGVSMGGMTTCALLTQHPEIQAAACVMGTPAPLKYRQRISQRTQELSVALPQDYFKLTDWITHFDLSSQIDTLAGRPLLFWHGTEDEKIPYEDVAAFVETVTHDEAQQVTFLSEEARHLVEGETMKQVTEFFVQQLLQA